MQLYLPIRLHDTASLDNFFPAGNEEFLSVLTAWLKLEDRVPSLFLHGVSGSGRSHLLQAVCHRVSDQGRPSVYVPAGEQGVGAELVSQLNPASVVCIDDLDQVAGVKVWEEAILELYERLLTSNGSLLISALQPPLALRLSLPDLATRLAAGGVYRLHPLAERELPAAMRLRAHRRGLDLPDAVVDYLLRRVSRDSKAVFDLLDQVDEAAFSRKRRLTVPFIKELEKG